MPTQDWRRIEGPVTACYHFGEQRRFDSLVEALSFHVYRWNYSAPRPRYYRDENGIVIPEWKLDEVARLNAPEDRVRAFWSRRRRHVFRQGPVEGIRCYRGGRSYYRQIATQPELRENDFLAYDEDAIDYGIKARGPRRRGALPNAWEDIHHGRQGRGWKNQRRTQWK